ncbi:MAG: hypothetical protein CL916_10230, partial [Deltaproteobacteria bacterium]|nr:hypothetical protein [Deltaproteobacteria bacterium]
MSSTENPAPQKNVNYRAQNFNGALWENRGFSEGDFSQIQANESRFSQISFDKSIFHAAIVRNAQWRHNRFASCAGRFMEMENTDLSGSIFQECRFEDSSFYEVNFDDSQWADCSANGCDFRYSSFKNATLQNINLSNCDLAYVDFTGCNFENVNAYNARITNSIGLSDAQRDQLLAGGAYEGLPPAINKLRKRSLSFQRDVQSRLSSLRDKVKPTTWVDTQGLVQKAQDTFQEWREERRRQQEELQRQEEEWRKEQETRRLKSIEDRRVREERRRQEKEAQQVERERLQERRRQEQEIQDLLQAQQSERQQLQKEIKQFFGNLEQRETEPKHIEAIGNQANTLYQDTEESLNLEDSLRDQLKQSPLDTDLQQRLTNQTNQTQQLASEALDAQHRYFKELQEWKRREHALLKRLQQEALSRSTQILLENKSQFTVDSDAFKQQILTIETQSHRDLLRAQLEHEQNAIRIEREELENEVSIDLSEPKEIEESLPILTTESTSNTPLSGEDFTDMLRSVKQRPMNMVVESDLTTTDLSDQVIQEIVEQLPSEEVLVEEDQETTSIHEVVETVRTEEYQSLFSRVAEWFTTTNKEVTADGPEVIEIDTLFTSETQEPSTKLTLRIETQYEQELTRIEEQIGSETLQPDLLDSLREIQQNSIHEILEANTETTFLSEEAIQNLQSDLITTSLLSFKEQLETERVLAEQKAELDRQRELEQKCLAEDREHAKRQQKELEELRRSERAALVQQRKVELETQHKKQLQSIIESRYAKFEKSITKSTEEEAESFNSVEELEVATTQLQQLQGLSFNQTVQTFIESEAQKQRLELEAKIRQEQLQRQRELDAQAEAQKHLERQEERKRKEAHRAFLKRQAEETKASARAAEIERREQLNKEKAKREAAEQKRQERLAKEKAEARAAESERRKQIAKEKEAERLAAITRKELLAKEK